MARVLTFSRKYPAYHHKAGEPTFFVEKIHQWLWDMHDLPYYSLNEMLWELNRKSGIDIDNFIETEISDTEDIFSHKSHTIRLGNRWRVGDMFSPRVWSGKPYLSKMITIAPDVEVKKVFDFCIDPFGGEYRMNGKKIPFEK